MAKDGLKAAGKPRAKKTGKRDEVASRKLTRPRTSRMPSKMSAANAQLLVTRSSAFMTPSLIMCVPTAAGDCIRFYYDPGTEQYFRKPGEPAMDCETCRSGA